MKQLTPFSVVAPNVWFAEKYSMTDPDSANEQLSGSRRDLLKVGTLATLGSAVGLSGAAIAQQDGNQTGQNGNQTNQTQQGDAQVTIQGMKAKMFLTDVRPGAVFQLASPEFEAAPTFGEFDDEGFADFGVGDAAGDEEFPADFLADTGPHTIEYFNTGQQAFLFANQKVDAEVGTLFQLTNVRTQNRQALSRGLVTVGFQPLDVENFVFDLPTADIGVLEGGGEAIVRPETFAGGALFTVTSDPLGWLPPKVEGSGFFSDYEARFAQYLGTDVHFAFFPQEEASVENGGVYSMESNFEILDPQGDLVSLQFQRINEDDIPVDNEFL